MERDKEEERWDDRAPAARQGIGPGHIGGQDKLKERKVEAQTGLLLTNNQKHRMPYL